MDTINDKQLEEYVSLAGKFNGFFSNELQTINKTLENIHFISKGKYEQFLIHELEKIQFGDIVVTINSHFNTPYLCIKIKTLNVEHALSGSDYMKLLKYDINIRDSIIKTINR